MDVQNNLDFEVSKILRHAESDDEIRAKLHSIGVFDKPDDAITPEALLLSETEYGESTLPDFDEIAHNIHDMVIDGDDAASIEMVKEHIRDVYQDEEHRIIGHMIWERLSKNDFELLKRYMSPFLEITLLTVDGQTHTLKLPQGPTLGEIRRELLFAPEPWRDLVLIFSPEGRHLKDLPDETILDENLESGQFLVTSGLVPKTLQEKISELDYKIKSLFDQNLEYELKITQHEESIRENQRLISEYAVQLEDLSSSIL